MSSVAEHQADRPILLFDGVCNLCNGVARFVTRHDPAPGRFRFAALQSELGLQILREHGLKSDAVDTFVMIEGERVHLRSKAGLRVLRRLGFPWSLAYAFIVVPRPLRDAVYDWVARNRYRWFGRQDACMVPTPEIRSRFLG